MIEMLKDRLFAIHTAHTSYVMGIDQDGILRHLYYGPSIPWIEDFLPELDDHGAELDSVMEEFSSYGCLRGKDASLKIAYSDRTRDFRYTVAAARVEGDALVLVLRDRDYAFEVEISYTAHAGHDIIERGVLLRNTGEESVTIERVFSAELSIPGDGFRVLNMSGHWGLEQQPHADLISGGKKIYESARGHVGFGCQPVFAAFQSAEEEKGEVWFGALRYSGNFKVSVEATPHHYLNVLMGMNDTDFSLRLAAGESFEAPRVYLGYTSDGFGDMSRRLHGFAHDCLMPSCRRDEELPVLYNSWYATTFSVRCEEQERLADKAAAIGVEQFVIDDGWFGQRHDDRAGLGDWYVNPDKFPQGLNHLIDHVHALGMTFGLWIEPEMVNPDSDLYRLHPDWVYSYPRRTILTKRNQYVLNLTMPEVQEWLLETFDRLLTENRIDYVKWDMNRFMAEALDADGKDGLVWHKHNRAFTRFVEALRQRHPDVSFEACAGGGARVNYETLSLFDMFWPSDNTGPIDRAAIQEGYSYFYPPKYMRAWVTDDSDTPLSLRVRCAMCGALGIGTNLNEASQQELDALKKDIVLYKRIRRVVQFGALYRLRSLKRDGWQVWQYVLGNRSVIIALVDHIPLAERLPAVRLRGLDAKGVYRVESETGERMLSGAYLMGRGIPVAGRAERRGYVTMLERVEVGL